MKNAHSFLKKGLGNAPFSQRKFSRTKELFDKSEARMKGLTGSSLSSSNSESILDTSRTNFREVPSILEDNRQNIEATARQTRLEPQCRCLSSRGQGGPGARADGERSKRLPEKVIAGSNIWSAHLKAFLLEHVCARSGGPTDFKNEAKVSFKPKLTRDRSCT